MSETGADPARDAHSRCLNCDAVLQGQWCHQCGQKAKAQVRHFGSVVTDILDTVFEYDNRIWRTLLPLYFVPGKISTDFMAGRRVRYVLPFRLFFVLSVVMFLTLQFSALPERFTGMGLNLGQVDGRFETMNSEAEVLAERDRVVAELESTLRELDQQNNTGSNLARSGLLTAIRVIDEAAAIRLEELREQDQNTDVSVTNPVLSVSTTPPVPPPMQSLEQPSAPAAPREPEIVFADSQIWHRDTNPLEIDWLPEWANESLNNGIARALLNLQSVSENPARLLEAMLNLLPLVLFFMMPVFALLLKMSYLFSRRLYMEHFIVALHSHSFLFFAVLISLLLNALAGIQALPMWATGILRNLYWLSVAWIPLYLFLMQRRVYAQGWIMTFIKYNVIGTLYVVLLFFALLAAAAISLVNL